MDRERELEVERTPVIGIAGRSVVLNIVNATSVLVNCYSGGYEAHYTGEIQTASNPIPWM